MNCQEVRERASEYLDRQMAPERIALVEDHLRLCPGCRQEVEALRRTVALLGSLDPVETAPDFLGQVHRKIERGSRVRRVWAWFFEPLKIKVPLEVAALFLVTIGAFFLYYKSPESPQEGMLRYSPEGPPVAEAPREKVPERRTEPASRLAQSRPEAPAKEKTEVQSLQLEAAKESPEVSVAAARPPEVLEIMTNDLPLYEQQVRALLARVEGRVLAEERSPEAGLLLTVELPRSHQAEFLAALKEKEEVQVGARALQSGPKARDQVTGRAQEGGVLSLERKMTAESAVKKDKPTVKLQLRILPKK